MPLNQASLLYHILRGVACRLCDKTKSERGKRPLYAARNLARAKCGNGVGWTRRIPAAEWRNRGGDWAGEAESPADAERGCTPPSGPLRGGFTGGYAEAEKIPAAAEKSASAAEKVAGEEKRHRQGRFLLGTVGTYRVS